MPDTPDPAASASGPPPFAGTNTGSATTTTSAIASDEQPPSADAAVAVGLADLKALVAAARDADIDAGVLAPFTDF